MAFKEFHLAAEDTSAAKVLPDQSLDVWGL